MIDAPHQNDRLLKLTERYCEQRLDAKQLQKLEQLLEADESARSIFLHYMAQHARLSWRMRDHPAQRMRRKTLTLRPRRLGVGPWLAAAAMLLAAVGLGLIIRSQLATDKPAPNTAHARIVMSLDPQWKGIHFNDGTVLDSAMHTLHGGMIQLHMPSGPSVVIEGPARFSITGNNSIRLLSGNLHADVPPSGHGFTVQTPSARFVDLGTRFSVLASESGDSELHVVEGKVDAYAQHLEATAPPTQTLTEGRGLRIDSGGHVKSMPARSNDYVDASRMLRLKARSAEYSQAIDLQTRDPELAILLDFENHRNQPMRNLATGYARASVPNHWLHSYTPKGTQSRTPLNIGRWVRYKHLGPDSIRLEVEDQGGPPHDDLIVEMQHAPDNQTHVWARKRTAKSPPGFTHELETADRRSIFGPITGAGIRWTIDTPQPTPIRLIGVDTSGGRLPFTQSVSFQQERARIVVPMVQTKVTALTVSAWVHLEPSDQHQPLVVPVGIPRAADWSWGIDPKGRLTIQTHHIDTPRSFHTTDPMPTGRWIHIATIYDAEHQLVTHVLNGKAFATEGLTHLPDDIAAGSIQVGRDLLGNQFAGRVDELSLWVRAVSVDQLRRHYETSIKRTRRP